MHQMAIKAMMEILSGCSVFQEEMLADALSESWLVMEKKLDGSMLAFRLRIRTAVHLGQKWHS